MKALSLKRERKCLKKSRKRRKRWRRWALLTKIIKREKNPLPWWTSGKMGISCLPVRNLLGWRAKEETWIETESYGKQTAVWWEKYFGSYERAAQRIGATAKTHLRAKQKRTHAAAESWGERRGKLTLFCISDGMRCFMYVWILLCRTNFQCNYS